MSKHSPAPWTFVRREDLTVELRQFEGDLGGFKDALGNWVCEFGDSTCYYPTEGTPPSDADARLIAAAPDLLAALLQIQRMGYADVGDRLMVDAAIRKATEETP